MGEAIALSSPSGKMSKQARSAATERLSESLFGKGGLKKPSFTMTQEKEKERDLNMAKQLRGFAAAGMGPRKHKKEAERLEAKWK